VVPGSTANHRLVFKVGAISAALKDNYALFSYSHGSVGVLFIQIRQALLQLHVSCVFAM